MCTDCSCMNLLRWLLATSKVRNVIFTLINSTTFTSALLFPCEEPISLSLFVVVAKQFHNNFGDSQNLSNAAHFRVGCLS